jgi:hypothetical protein
MEEKFWSILSSTENSLAASIALKKLWKQKLLYLVASRDRVIKRTG